MSARRDAATGGGLGWVAAAVGVLVLGVLCAAPAAAQRQTRRRPAPIEIRGQVPTPQVVTVRPREVPAYSRQVLVPNFYDRDFWASILPPYDIVPRRALSGTAADTAGSAGPAAAPPTPVPTSPPPSTPPGRIRR